MNAEDTKWLKKCLDDPTRYKIYVDNDMIFIVECTPEDPDGMDSDAYTFSSFGEDFIIGVLEYLGGNVSYV